jgi:hypothetical protein
VTPTPSSFRTGRTALTLAFSLGSRFGRPRGSEFGWKALRPAKSQPCGCITVRVSIRELMLLTDAGCVEARFPRLLARLPPFGSMTRFIYGTTSCRVLSGHRIAKRERLDDSRNDDDHQNLTPETASRPEISAQPRRSDGSDPKLLDYAGGRVTLVITGSYVRTVGSTLRPMAWRHRHRQGSWALARPMSDHKTYGGQ